MGAVGRPCQYLSISLCLCWVRRAKQQPQSARQVKDATVFRLQVLTVHCSLPIMKHHPWTYLCPHPDPLAPPPFFSGFSRAPGLCSWSPPIHISSFFSLPTPWSDSLWIPYVTVTFRWSLVEDTGGGEGLSRQLKISLNGERLLEDRVVRAER